MNTDFIPFGSDASSRTEPAFQPPAPAFAAVAELTSPSPTSPPCDQQELQIELKRDGDRISRIRIQCRCGEVIELDCEY